MAAVLLAAVLTACVGAAPAGYHTNVCLAMTHLAASEEQLATISEDLDAQDSDALALSASAMQREADAATEALAALPDWAPGAALIEELAAAASGYGRAATLFQRAARQGLGPIIDEAVAGTQGAAAALSRAVAEETNLSNQDGWQAC